MNGLKDTLKRVQAWVKKNPKKAGVVAVVIVVLAYFAIKKSANSTGESLGGGESTGESGLDSFGGGVASEGGDSTFPAGSSGAILDSSPTAVVPTNSGGGYDLTSPDLFSSFGATPSSFVNTTPLIPSNASPASVIATPLGGGIAGNANLNSGKAAADAIANATPLKSGIAGNANLNSGKAAADAIANATPLKSGIAGNANLNSGKAAADTVVKKSNSGTRLGKTDAEKAGLAKFYTGIYGGKIYAGGWITGKAPVIATNKKNASVRAV